MSISNEGQTYITRYKVAAYPHLAIIDPRTGSLLWRKEGWTQVRGFVALNHRSGVSLSNRPDSPPCASLLPSFARRSIPSPPSSSWR